MCLERSNGAAGLRPHHAVNPAVIVAAPCQCRLNPSGRGKARVLIAGMPLVIGVVRSIVTIAIPITIGIVAVIPAEPPTEMTVVIVLTSSQQRSDIRLAYSLGANSYLVKPSNPQNLFELTELIKNYWLQLN